MRIGRQALWLVDGFNLYHSLRRCEAESGAKLRWLNLWKLAENAQSSIGSDCLLGAIGYFSALPHHLATEEPGRVERHEAYIRALTAWRPACWVKLGHFQPRRDSGHKIWHEKGTDMAIAAAAVKAALNEDAGEIIIVSGDSDFIPLAELMKESFPKVRLRFGFPAHRGSRKLARMCPGSFHIRPEAYAKAQFPETVRLPSGKQVVRPTRWT